MKSATFTVLVGVLAVVTALAAGVAGIPEELGQMIGAAAPQPANDARYRDMESRITDLQTRVDELEARAEAPSPTLAGPTITRDDVRKEARRAAAELIDKEKAALRAEPARGIPERIVVESDGGPQDLETLFDAFAERRDQRKREEQKARVREKMREGLEKRRERSMQMADRFSERLAKNLELDENQAATVQSALTAYANDITDIQLQLVDGQLDKEGAKAARKQALERMNNSVELDLSEEQFQGFQKSARAFSDLTNGRGREERRLRFGDRGGFKQRRGFRGGGR